MGGIASVSWARQLQDEGSGVNPALSAAVWWSWHSNTSGAEPGRWHGAARVSSGWPKTRVSIPVALLTRKLLNSLYFIKWR